MSTVYLCGWCDQEIRKGMRCGSIYGSPDCPWPARLQRGSVKDALREAAKAADMQKAERPAPTVSPARQEE